MKLGLSAETEVTAARESADLEVRLRAARILVRLRGLQAQRAFLAAMEGSWHKALTEGRLAGPLLGARSINAQPLPMNKTFETAPLGLEAVRFLARVQSLDGRWNARVFGAQVPADVEQTALALLSFLGAGHTEKVGQYSENVRCAVAWLKSRQGRDGAILNEGWTQFDGVTHALASIALSEAAGMGKQADTIEAAQKAMDWAVENCQWGEGYDRTGFIRSADSQPDLFATTFFTMALRSAKESRLRVGQEAFEGIIKFLDLVEDKEHHSYRFLPLGKPSPCAAIMGVVCRQLLMWKKEDLRETVVATLKDLGEPTVDLDDSDMLINYFGTLAAFYQGGEIWKNWNEPLKKNLVDAQIRQGPADGAWAPKGVWAGGGYILSTSLSALSLEVYYRYLPMYK